MRARKFPSPEVSAERIRSILIVKLSSLGDVLLATAVLPCIRSHFPAASVDWVVETEGRDILRPNPALRRVIVFPRRELAGLLPFSPVRARRLWRAFKAELQAERYDLILDLQGLARSWVVSLSARLAPLGARAGKGRFLGIRSKSPHRRAFLRHAVPSYFEVLEVLGFPAPPLQDMRVSFAPACVDAGDETAGGARDADSRKGCAEHTEQAEFFMKKFVFSQTPYIVFHAFTTWQTKHWPEEHWVRLAELVFAHGLAQRVVISGSRVDSARAEALCAKIRLASAAADALPARGTDASSWVVNAAGNLSFAGFARLAAGARAVVSVDSFPMHLAAAVGARVISLHGPSDPARTGPWGEGCRALSAAGSCRPLEEYAGLAAHGGRECSAAGGAVPRAGREARRDAACDPAAATNVNTAPREPAPCGRMPCRRRRCPRWKAACMRRITPERVFAALVEYLNGAPMH